MDAAKIRVFDQYYRAVLSGLAANPEVAKAADGSKDPGKALAVAALGLTYQALEVRREFLRGSQNWVDER